MTATRLLAAIATAATLASVSPAAAQDLAVRGLADAGLTSFTATRSFEAIFGSSQGPTFGGGIEFIERRVFVRIHASQFRRTGERIFVFEGQTFPLGIENTVTIRPIELSAGYRFGRQRVVPYVGGGVGWHRYHETGEFATDEDEVDETFTGYQVVGGAEFRLSRWLGAALEGQWTTVPDALGQDPVSVSSAYGDTDLGGITVRARVVIGR